MECKFSKSRNGNEEAIRLDGQDILQSNNFGYLKWEKHGTWNVIKFSKSRNKSKGAIRLDGLEILRSDNFGYNS